MSLSDREREIRLRLKLDFQHYAPRCLRIRSKAGAIVPFYLNSAQNYLHERLERQRRETGKVRAVVLKGRQQGISTYIGGRFYHRTTHSRGQRCFILTHEQEATNNLFGMVERYHEHCPMPVRDIALVVITAIFAALVTWLALTGQIGSLIGAMLSAAFGVAPAIAADPSIVFTDRQAMGSLIAAIASAVVALAFIVFSISWFFTKNAAKRKEARDFLTLIVTFFVGILTGWAL